MSSENNFASADSGKLGSMQQQERTNFSTATRKQDETSDRLLEKHTWNDSSFVATSPNEKALSAQITPRITTPSTVGSTPESTKIPISYLEKIQSAFGMKADLYDDILKVGRTCSSRDLRIAYFRRGREVLSEREYREDSNFAVSISGEVSKKAKERFQAISMTYEILSNPRWKDAYDAQNNPIDDFLVQAFVTTDPSSPLLRDSVSLCGRSRSRNGVRWNESVEELVFEQDPIERRTSRNPSKKRRKCWKRQKSVAMENGGLESHLKKLDKESKRDLVSKFIDKVESNIEELESNIEELFSPGSAKSQDSKIPGERTAPTRLEQRPYCMEKKQKSKQQSNLGQWTTETPTDRFPARRLSFKGISCTDNVPSNPARKIHSNYNKKNNEEKSSDEVVEIITKNVGCDHHDTDRDNEQRTILIQYMNIYDTSGHII